MYDISFTFHSWRHVPRFRARSAGELAQKSFQQIKRFPDQDQDYDVGYQESSSAVFVRGERKSPHVAQSNGSGYAGHEELQPAAPLGLRLKTRDQFTT
jgi:hypothetical protein